MSHESDDLDDLWGSPDDEPKAPAATPAAKVSDSTKPPANADTKAAASVSPTAPVSPTSTPLGLQPSTFPLRPSSTPPRPTSRPPARAGSASKPPVSPSSPVPAARSLSGTLIGVPAPLVVKPALAKEEPSEGARPADVNPATTSSETKASARVTADAAPATSSNDAKPAEPSNQPGDGETTKPDRPSARTEKPVTKSAPTVSYRPSSPDASSSTRNLLLVSVVLAAAILGGRYYLERKNADAPPPVAEAVPAANPTPPPQPAPEAPREEPPTPAAAPTESTAAAVSAPPAAAPATSVSAFANAAPAPSGSAPAEGTRVVVVKISPPQAKLWRKGKAVGSSPVTIELAPGEKRSYEVGMPGWVTRRLVVDGSKPEIFIGLKPAE
jgi:hypothetical protein